MKIDGSWHLWLWHFMWQLIDPPKITSWQLTLRKSGENPPCSRSSRSQKMARGGCLNMFILEKTRKRKHNKMARWQEARKGIRIIVWEERFSLIMIGFVQGVARQQLELLGPILAHVIRPLVWVRGLWSIELEKVWKSIHRHKFWKSNCFTSLTM